MFEHIVLEPDQQQLLGELVEIERSVPREKRGRFLVAQSMGSHTDTFIHNGGPRLEGHLEDVEILARNGLVAIFYGSRGTPNFYVTPEGFRYYEEMKRAGAPVETIEEELRAHLSSDEFSRSFPEAYAKWSQAESLLWGTDSHQQLTTVGHLCREAVYAFAEELLLKHQIPQPHPPKTNVVARLRTAIEAKSATLGATERAFLEALVPYWGTISDLAQRQEHGAERDSDELLWEDARRLVFQTLIVFYEIHRALERFS